MLRVDDPLDHIVRRVRHHAADIDPLSDIGEGTADLTIAAMECRKWYGIRRIRSAVSVPGRARDRLPSSREPRLPFGVLSSTPA